MMKKTLILGLIVCSLIVVSANSVVTADETKTIVDDEGDVTNGLETVTSSENIDVDNIDIMEVTYSQDGSGVTFTLKVKGIIENRGDIDDILDINSGEFDYDREVDGVGYSLVLETSDEMYWIDYVNNKCKLTYYSALETVDVPSSDFSVNNDILTVSFDLNSTDETCGTIWVLTMYTKMPDLSSVDPDDYDDYLDLIEELYDDAMGECGDGNDNGNGNNSDGTNGNTDNTGGDNIKDDSSGSGLLLFVAVIAIICIIGVAVIAYIIRR